MPPETIAAATVLLFAGGWTIGQLIGMALEAILRYRKRRIQGQRDRNK